MVPAIGIALDIDVEHKNEDDTTWTTLGSFSSMSTAGTFSLNLTGIKEQVRLAYEVSGSNAYDAVHFLMLAPAWRPY